MIWNIIESQKHTNQSVLFQSHWSQFNLVLVGIFVTFVKTVHNIKIAPWCQHFSREEVDLSALVPRLQTFKVNDLIETDTSEHHNDPLFLFNLSDCLKFGYWFALLLPNYIQLDIFAGSFLDQLDHDALYETLVHVQEYSFFLLAQS